MLSTNKKTITLADRPWAGRSKYKKFLGTYVLEAESGIFFAEGMPPHKVQTIVQAFLKLPEQLQETCRAFAVTVSTCTGLTENGNSSTTYADFQQRSKSRISPHIEIGSRSLAPPMLLPHLAHEAAHIWWRQLSAEARQDYKAYLARSCSARTIEVTDYCHDFFADWLRSLAIPDTESYAQNHRESYLEKWSEESFCDTVAKLVSPDYPSYRSDCNVSLSGRRSKIRKLTGLAIKKH